MALQGDLRFRVPNYGSDEKRDFYHILFRLVFPLICSLLLATMDYQFSNLEFIYNRLPQLFAGQA